MPTDVSKIPLNVIDGDPDGKDWKLPPLQASKLEASLPESFSRAGTILDQGNEGSCVGVSGKTTNEDEFVGDEKLSALWLYTHAKKMDEWLGEDYDGTSISGACKALMKFGICTESFFPYKLPIEAPLKGAAKDASHRKIKNYYVVPNNVDTIKQLLYNRCLWTSFEVYQELYNVSRITGCVDTLEYLRSKKCGGHAIAMTGWATIDDKFYFEFQNSWGADWGKRGIFYMEPKLFFNIGHKIYYTSTNYAPGTDIVMPIEDRRFFISIIKSIIRKIKAIFGR